MSGSEDLQGWWAVEPKTGQENGDVYGNPSASGSSAQGQQPQRQAYGDVTSGNQFAALVNREGGNGEGDVVQPTSSQSLINRGAGAMSSSFDSPGSQKLRVRRSTYVPGWAVPPRVLLVDDDAVSRKLSSKFLKVFGCTIDVAVDGVGAVNKMNLEKYDLVLMDIVMPKLDGVSATSLIRKFDQGTPIISMTSNSKPNEIMTYYSSGMNDILPKPFSKEGLLEMLEVRFFS
jgi:osomolarity two-component system response regulator SKN7